MIRRTILVAIALLFLVPAVVLAVDVFTLAMLGTDEFAAMVVGSIALGSAGLILLWIAFDMGRKGDKRPNDSDLTAMGLAHLVAAKDLLDDTDSTAHGDSGDS